MVLIFWNLQAPKTVNFGQQFGTFPKNACYVTREKIKTMQKTECASTSTGGAPKHARRTFENWRSSSRPETSVRTPTVTKWLRPAFWEHLWQVPPLLCNNVIKAVGPLSCMDTCSSRHLACLLRAHVETKRQALQGQELEASQADVRGEGPRPLPGLLNAIRQAWCSNSSRSLS